MNLVSRGVFFFWNHELRGNLIKVGNPSLKRILIHICAKFFFFFTYILRESWSPDLAVSQDLPCKIVNNMSQCSNLSVRVIPIVGFLFPLYFDN